MASGISHTRLTPFGADVTVDLAKGLTQADKEELRRLYSSEGLILVRDVHLSHDEQKEFSGIFGPVLNTPEVNFLVSNVREGGIFANLELAFHTDVPYVPAPFLGASLYALDITEGASGTMFASGLRAYERLPQRLRDRVDGLNALYVRTRTEDRRTKLTDLAPTDNCAVHPVIGRQKGTGRRYIYANGSSTACIIGVSEAESDALIEELCSYLYAPDNIYEHPWVNGDLVVWDNFTLQHARKKISHGNRTLQRVTLGRFGYLEQYPVDGAVYGELAQGQGWEPRDDAA